ARTLRQPEIAALAEHATAQRRCIDADRVVAGIAGILVPLLRRLDVRADAAVPQQVHRRGEDRADERLAIHALTAFGHAERRACLRRQRDLLDAARHDEAALTENVAVVVVPAGARQTEQSLTLDE